MNGVLETPSRVWRRIEAIEGREVPSLPSLPAFEEEDTDDLNDNGLHTETSESDMLDEDLLNVRSPLQSTPAASTVHHTAVSTIHPPSSTASMTRFASSIASRSTKSSSSSLSASHARRSVTTRRGQHDSFDVSIINPVARLSDEPATEDEAPVARHTIRMGSLGRSVGSDGRLEHIDDSLSSDGLGPSSSPYVSARSIAHGLTPKKGYNSTLSLRSDAKASPLDKYRNVALRRSRTAPAGTRTPSLTRTTPSPNSSPSHSTPHSTRSMALPDSPRASSVNPYTIPLPRSNTGSPAVLPERNSEEDYEEEPSLPEDHLEDLQSLDSQHSVNPDLAQTSADPQGEPAEDQDQDHEPTFSSEGDQTSRATARNSPLARNLSSTSSIPSIAATPMPGYPRRARFAGFSSDQSDDLENSDPKAQELEDPLTPHTRRRSFLLSVINSTTRPRMKIPTPHPKIVVQEDSIVATVDSTPRQVNNTRVNLQTALAGVTPRPRAGFSRQPRPSHPLSQMVAPSPDSSRSDSILDSSPTTPGPTASSQGSNRRSSLGNAVPSLGYLSPYDGANDKASFISTASSHDLTAHHRVNTSFDPAMGFGNGAGQGVGRFNANKLNNYLHGLNRRLQEENEVLLDRLRKAEEAQHASGNMSSATSSDKSRRRSSTERRISVGGTTLDNVEEGQGWLEEKAELEEMVDALNDDLARLGQAKEEAEQVLKEELEEKERSKQRWKARMAEVEESVAGIISDLELKVKDAEERAWKAEQEQDQQRDDQDFEVLQLRAELDVATKRFEAVEHALENQDDMGVELKEANDRIGLVMANLRNANAQIKDLETELHHSQDRVHDLEKEVHDHRDTILHLEEQLAAQEERLHAENKPLDDGQLEDLQAQIEELEEGAVSAVRRVDELEHELACTNAELEAVKISEAASTQELEIKAQNAQELARQMEDALHEAEQKMSADEETLRQLQSKITSLERDRQRDASLHEVSRNPFVDTNGPTDADVEALEKELDEANQEIGRLTTLLNQSPARKAVEKAKDVKVEMLEREREELLERNKALRMAMNDFHTPHKMINASGISPIHRQVLAMSIRVPKTPGAPLKDLSWLNATTMDPTVSPLVAEIQRLQQELDMANESIDDKLDKLEEAGLGVVGLTQKLEDARSKISALEDEIARLTRREERRLRVMERAKCKKCQIKVNLDDSMDISHDSFHHDTSPASRSSDHLRVELQATNADLAALKSKWDQERLKLKEENAVLRDATNRLNAEVRHVKEENRRATDAGNVGQKEGTGVQGELNKTLRLVADLEADLKSERARLRALSSEQDHVQKEKAQILRQLQRTTSDMEDVKEQLQKVKSENQALEREMRESNSAEKKARLLEAKVVENSEAIEQLRHERALLAVDHKNLQKKYTETSEQANRLRQRYDASSTSHDERRHQLDLRLLEITDLKRALATQADELEKAQDENDRIMAERRDVAHLVEDLETDLRRVKKDAEAFQRDLRFLRAEKDKQEGRYEEELTKLERSKKQTQTQLKLLNEELDIQRARISQAKDELENHVCQIDGGDNQQLLALKTQHNKECKGLLVNIKYLKAKFTRESEMRFRLSYQKHYLVVLLSQFEKSERTIFAAIAGIGFGTPITVKPPRKPKKLRSVVLSIVFLTRASRESKVWREQRAFKGDVLVALEDVRRRRAITGSNVWYPH